jgi:hypothetical protein
VAIISERGRGTFLPSRTCIQADHVMFRKLGMRHLCVTDGDNNLVGTVTRKDLMAYKIVENIMTPTPRPLQTPKSGTENLRCLISVPRPRC